MKSMLQHSLAAIAASGITPMGQTRLRVRLRRSPRRSSRYRRYTRLWLICQPLRRSNTSKRQ